MASTKVKLDEGKLRYDLMPFKALDEVARVLTYGINKYPEPEQNWYVNSTEVDLKRYKAAILRHLSRVMQGEQIDEESGLRHLAQIATNCLFLIELEDKFEIRKETENASK